MSTKLPIDVQSGMVIRASQSCFLIVSKVNDKSLLTASDSFWDVLKLPDVYREELSTKLLTMIMGS
jgi:hypothetical protein